MNLPTIPGFDQQAFQKYLKNTGWLFMARVGSLIIKILAGIAVANYLGPADSGVFNYPLVYISFFIAAAALGLDGYVTRQLLANPENKSLILGTAFRMRFLAGLLVIPLSLLIFVLISGKDDTIPLIYILIASCIGLAQSINIIDSYFQATIQAKYVMIVQVAGNLISAAVKVFLIFIGAPLYWFIWTLLADSLILGGAYFITYRSSGNSLAGWKFETALAKNLLERSWPLAFAAILVTLYMRIGQLMIKSFLGVDALGVYSTVISWGESFYFIPVAIVTSVFPAIMNARRDDPKRYQKRLQDLYDLMVGISLPIAVLMSFLSPWIYRVFYIPQFSEGAIILSIHVWGGVFVFLGSASGQYLIAEGYTRHALYRTAAGAFVNVVLGLFWIPEYGLQGAAYATLLAYFTATFFVLIFPETRHQGIKMLKSIFLISFAEKLIRRP